MYNEQEAISGNKFPVLRTDRLELVQITVDNVKDIYELFSDTQVVAFYNLLPFQKEEEAAAIIEKLQALYNERLGIRWGIRLKGTTKIIGSAGFNNYTKNHRANIGYDLKPEYWNKGIVTEAIKAIVNYGFDTLQVNRIEAEVMSGNVFSERVLEKCDFKNEGLLRSWMFWNDKHFDMTIFSILKSDVNINLDH